MLLAFTFQQVISISGLILIDTRSDKQINLQEETYSDSLARTCWHGAAIFKGPGRAEPVHAVPAAVAAAAAGQGRILPGGIEQSQESHESTRRCSKYVSKLSCDVIVLCIVCGTMCLCDCCGARVLAGSGRLDTSTTSLTSASREKVCEYDR